MYTLKGFAIIPSYVSNEYGVVSQYGELSNKSLTYSLEQEVHRSNTNAGTRLMVFSSKGDSGEQVQVEPAVAEDILAITQWIYTASNSGSLGTDSATVVSNLLTDFTSIDSVEVGPIGDDGTRNMPSYISFQFTGLNEENYIKVWFEDEAFQSQYDEYVIKSIGPIATFDDFHTLQAIDLEPLLNEQTKSSLIDDLVELSGDNPPTRMRGETFTWIDPIDGTELQTVWGVAIYGQAGNNIDNIRRALIEYVLADSSYTSEEWIEVIPDLFRSNEYIIVPRWDVLAIPTESAVAGVYSPSVHVKDISVRYAAFYPDYEASHLLDNGYITSSAFNNVPLFVVGGPENKEESYDFLAKFPDYTAISPSSDDFLRMSSDTQSFIKKLLELIIAAETATDFSQLPTGVNATINRITRGDNIYISASHDGVEYMVVTKSTYEEVLS